MVGSLTAGSLNSHERVIMGATFKRELIMFGVSLLLVVLSFIILFHVHKAETSFIYRLETSIPQSCEMAIVRGGRGETYNGYLVTLIDRQNAVWRLKVKNDHRLAVFCEQYKQKGVVWN